MKSRRRKSQIEGIESRCARVLVPATDRVAEGNPRLRELKGTMAITMGSALTFSRRRKSQIEGIESSLALEAEYDDEVVSQKEIPD